MAKLDMTDEQFQAALSAAASGGASAALAALGIKASESTPQTPNEMFAAQLKNQRQSSDPPIKVQMTPDCVSQLTGAKFTAHSSHGTIFAIPDYVYPPGIETHTPEGGLVPDRMAIKDTHGQYTAEYKQWRWESFWQIDLKAYVGKPLPAYLNKAA